MNAYYKGKKILMISASFFGYEKEICKKLESFGCIVDYFDERPKNDFITKSLIRLNRKLLAHKSNAYYREIIRQTKERQYDFIFVIKGEAISKKNLEELRRLHQNARMILYLWDALSYSPNSNIIRHMFDDVYTFDKNDAAVYEKMQFRPLFFIDEYRVSAQSKAIQDIDVLFIGTVHTDRFKVLKRIEKQLVKKNLNYYFYHYYPSKKLFYLKCLVDRSMRKYGKAELQYEKLSKEEITHLFNRSKVIIDIERPKQNGLTMRTIEVFGAQKKLITTNESIKEYDLYHPSNITLIDRHNPIIDRTFIYQGYVTPPEQIYEKYSLDEWLHEIFLHTRKVNHHIVKVK
ncbi:hypothetical protein [Jeotgalibacillus sp. R-1-5s-1]|uniref:hypothetical protein n=1 Tax=Jeotgalibacillus sp. R-1-5s-1 TaxID=2555897 RepID=UPI00106CD41E|nr:hypothetical protein [Jeotgalibacillus sp. R-1-5s-1]TFE00030.1 hypothetical protein E2491_06190 [Jeotgalibacillus sp. R-1-5s-1]